MTMQQDGLPPDRLAMFPRRSHRLIVLFIAFVLLALGYAAWRHSQRRWPHSRGGGIDSDVTETDYAHRSHRHRGGVRSSARAGAPPATGFHASR
jgi:hypothetical protein